MENKCRRQGSNHDEWLWISPDWDWDCLNIHYSMINNTTTTERVHQTEIKMKSAAWMAWIGRLDGSKKLDALLCARFFSYVDFIKDTPSDIRLWDQRYITKATMNEAKVDLLYFANSSWPMPLWFSHKISDLFVQFDVFYKGLSYIALIRTDACFIYIHQIYALISTYCSWEVWFSGDFFSFLKP